MGRHPAPPAPAGYLRDLAFEPAAAKEVRVFGLSGWLLDSFSGAWHDVMDTVWRRRRGAVVRRILVLAAVVLTHAVAFGVIVQAARSGEIGPERLVVLVPAIMAVAWLGNANSYTIAVALGAVNLPAVTELEAHLATYRSPGVDPPPARPTHAIRFEGVSFRYPTRDRPVYEDLDLTTVRGRAVRPVPGGDPGHHDHPHLPPVLDRAPGRPHRRPGGRPGGRGGHRRPGRRTSGSRR